MSVHTCRKLSSESSPPITCLTVQESTSHFFTAFVESLAGWEAEKEKEKQEDIKAEEEKKKEEEEVKLAW